MTDKMYSEEVMNHFQNPKNMGEMEDPDVTAKIGNPACVLPETEIHKRNSKKPIKEIKEGDEVIGHKKEIGEVKKTIENKYDGKLLKLSNELGEVYLTPDHLVRSIKTTTENKDSLKDKEKLKNKVAWHHAIELEKEDIVTYPITNKSNEIKNQKTKNSWKEKDVIYTPINEIEEKNYNGEVNNLEVEETKSFLTDSFLLHNCGDVMEIYLKVEENEEGEKFVKDIKFKTFGCAAAIATSSVTTELVKGMTLDEAEKITNQDVANELGGLPKIKMHCSNLSANGLHKALYKYKKEHDMEISDDLEAKYKASERALEETEEVREEIED